jgi:signal peptidase II
MLYAIVAVLAIILDQVVKYAVETKVVLDAIGNDVVRLIPGFVHVTNIHNYGAAFSFLQGARWFFVVLCILFAIVVVYVLVKDIIRTPVARWMAVIVLAGAIGNCIDRIVCGYVVDMFEFEFFRFPVFNIADIYITLGAIGLCLCLLLEKPKRAAAETAPAAAEPGAAPRASAARRTPRRHYKTEIPVFPARTPAAPPPVMDPNDPFAEWERRAAEPAPGAHVTYTQPEVPAPAVQPAQPAAPAVYPAPAAVPQPAVPQPAAPAAPAAPAPKPQPAAPKAEPAPAAPTAPAAPAADEFDLESILAEFRDL